MGARIHSQQREQANALTEVRRRVLQRAAMITLMSKLPEVLTERRTNLFVGMELPLWRGQWSSLFRRFSGRNVMNQFHASATNESGVFAGVGRERHRWGASCIAHAHWQPLPPRSCVL
jgi:hypothetical protein